MWSFLVKWKLFLLCWFPLQYHVTPFGFGLFKLHTFFFALLYGFEFSAPTLIRYSVSWIYEFQLKQNHISNGKHTTNEIYSLKLRLISFYFSDSVYSFLFLYIYFLRFVSLLLIDQRFYLCILLMCVSRCFRVTNEQNYAMFSQSLSMLSLCSMHS